MSTPSITFRAPRTSFELESLLRIRYKTYRDSRNSEIVSKNDYDIDIDSWDRESHHFGLFQTQPEQVDQAIGYMRVVDPALTTPVPFIENIIYKYSEVVSHRDRKEEYSYPTLSYWPNRAVLETFLAKATKNGTRVVETGRFALLEQFRSHSLATFAVESALSLFFFEKGYENAFWTCNSHSAAFYKRYGLAELDQPHFIYGHNISLLAGSSTTVPTQRGNKLRRLAEEYRTAKQFTYRCTSPLDATNSFSDTNRYSTTTIPTQPPSSNFITQSIQH
jgi:hypothetical protein